MLRLMSFKRGQTVRKYSIYQGCYFAIQWNYCEAANSDPLWSEYIKGTITTTPSGRDSFNNCAHTELYGVTYIPSYNALGEPLTPGLSWSIVPSPGMSTASVEMTLTNFPGSLAGAYGICHYPDSGKWVGLGFSISEAGHAKTAASAGRRKDICIKNMSTESEYRPVQLQAKIETISKPNKKNQVVSIIQSAVNVYQNEFDNLFSFSKYDSEGFTQALNNIQDVPTCMIAAGIAIDGLIMQAVSSSTAVLNNLARQGKSLDKLKNIGKLDLAVNYGVLAPFRDYVDFYKTVTQYYKDGLNPFFETGTTTRLSKKLGAWSMELYYGIHYNPMQSNLIQDSFGIAYQAGLGLPPTQIWDLIPFSFAVDWLLNVQGLLETLDAELNSQRYPVKYCWHTVKATRNVRILNTDCSLVYYNRVALDTVPPISADFSWHGVKGTLSLRNIDEAVSLLGQYIL